MGSDFAERYIRRGANATLILQGVLHTALQWALQRAGREPPGGDCQRFLALTRNEALAGEGSVTPLTVALTWNT